MIDLAKTTALDGGLVIWEECARDGAQGKTLMVGDDRIAVAKQSGRLFGVHGPNHVIFAAGFPSICAEEAEIVHRLAGEVDECTLASHGRATRTDVDLGLRALRGARHARATFFIPLSLPMAHALGLGTPEAALARGLETLAYALDHAGGLPIDVTLSDTSRADPSFVADAVNNLAAAGASIIKLCDTVGSFYPQQCRRFFQAVFAKLDPGAIIGVHQHNDFGFALANNLEAINAGARIVASSWLGLGERNGLAATEQLIFALSQAPQGLPERLGHAADFWLTPPTLRGLVPIANLVSEITGVPLRVTDAIVGSGVGTISTGTPFHAPAVFQPFDPNVLGVEPLVLLTQLANGRIIAAVAAERGIVLTPAEIAAAMSWVKAEAYRSGRAVIPKTEFFEWLAGQQSDRGVANG